jgi:hypothetical protein
MGKRKIGTFCVQAWRFFTVYKLFSTFPDHNCVIMVNYKVHRVRFVPYIPQAIHCLAVEGRKQPRIAISRYLYVCTCFIYSLLVLMILITNISYHHSHVVSLSIQTALCFRADSSIEIWNIEDNWYLERVIILNYTVMLTINCIETESQSRKNCHHVFKLSKPP